MNNQTSKHLFLLTIYLGLMTACGQTSADIDLLEGNQQKREHAVETNNMETTHLQFEATVLEYTDPGLTHEFMLTKRKSGPICRFESNTCDGNSCLERNAEINLLEGYAPDWDKDGTYPSAGDPVIEVTAPEGQEYFDGSTAIHKRISIQELGDGFYTFGVLFSNKQDVQLEDNTLIGVEVELSIGSQNTFGTGHVIPKPAESFSTYWKVAQFEIKDSELIDYTDDGFLGRISTSGEQCVYKMDRTPYRF